MPRGKRLKSPTKEVVVSVYRYFEKMERKNKGRNPCSLSSLKRTSEATSTVSSSQILYTTKQQIIKLLAKAIFLDSVFLLPDTKYF